MEKDGAKSNKKESKVKGNKIDAKKQDKQVKKQEKKGAKVKKQEKKDVKVMKRPQVILRKVHNLKSTCLF